MSDSLIISEVTFAAVQAQAMAAHVKHGKNSILNREISNEKRLVALAEEFGEVANAMTYDEGDPIKLVRELLQVAAVAVTWVEALDGHPQ